MFEIRVDEAGKVFLSGRLDASQVDKAKAVLDGVSGSTNVDLGDLDYISSAGLSVLLTTYKRLGDAGHTLKLSRVNQRILNVFSYAGLDRIFVIEPGLK